jgi:hypothetical protein
MTELRHKVKNALDECRTLILCAQVLLGFQFRSFLEQEFEKLPASSRYASIAGLGCLLIAIVLLFLPAAFHRLVESGEDTDRLHRFVTSVMCWALLPFALGFGIDTFIAGERVLAEMAGLWAGLTVLLTAILFWYGLEWLARQLGWGDTQMEKSQSQEKLNAKIEHVLTEIRMVLPGVQALLGFQMTASIMQSFANLPESSKQFHLAALLLVALSAIFLMTPSAYHRIVEHGENTARFHRFAGQMLIASMISLPLGIGADLFVVIRKATGSVAWGATTGLLSMLLAWGLWFGLTLARRAADVRQHQLEERLG